MLAKTFTAESPLMFTHPTSRKEFVIYSNELPCYMSDKESLVMELALGLYYYKSLGLSTLGLGGQFFQSYR